MASTPKQKPSRKTRKQTPSMPAGFGNAVALGAAAHVGSRLMKSIFDSASSTISITIESAEVRESISLSTHGLKLFIKPTTPRALKRTN